MKLLLDAQMIVWFLYAPEQITAQTKKLIVDNRDDLYFSHASIWELLNKIGRGKLFVAGNSPDKTLKDIIALRASVIPITQAHILLAASLPHHHSDPFDRMLIAQAQSFHLTILTSDKLIPLYDVKVIQA